MAKIHEYVIGREYEFHPVAEIFPLLGGQELQQLADDIRQNGQRHRIILHPDNDSIIDGRNRYLAALAEGMTPEFEYWDGKGDLVKIVVSLNLHRRHLTPSQLGMVGARIANMRQGERTDVEPSANLQKVSRADAAELLSVSERTVNSAKVVLDQAIPEIIAAVDRGSLPVSTAAAVANLDESQQEQVAQIIASGQRVTSAEVKKQIADEKKLELAVPDLALPLVYTDDDLADDGYDDEYYEGGDDGDLADETVSETIEKLSTKQPMTAANHNPSTEEGYDGDEWYTPSDIVAAATRAVMGQIDLDPASCAEAQAIVGADTYYDKEFDSLRDEVSWDGAVWMNPPYSMPLIKLFVGKLLEQYELGNVAEAIVITNNSSETEWYHQLLSASSLFCIKRRRTPFWRKGEGTRFETRQGQTIFYIGENGEAFAREFSAFGIIAEIAKIAEVA